MYGESVASWVGTALIGSKDGQHLQDAFCTAIILAFSLIKTVLEMQRVLAQPLHCPFKHGNFQCRFREAVTAFAPGSHQHMPYTATSLQNVFMAGDWVSQGPGTHGAKGLSQEKAYVTGIQAGNQVSNW